MAGRLLPACQGTDEQVLLGLHQGLLPGYGFGHVCEEWCSPARPQPERGLVGWLGVCVCGGVYWCVH